MRRPKRKHYYEPQYADELEKYATQLEKWIADQNQCGCPECKAFREK